MSALPPLILLAFANEREAGAAYLRALPDEQRSIRRALEPAVAQGWCEVEVLSNTSIDDLFDTFQKQRYRDRVAVLHYGGHAASFELLLESVRAAQNVRARSEGLVSFLGAQQGLQLVFLNGCCTEPMAQSLNGAGIPMVIGTFKAIDDGVAQQIAARFYNGLGQGAGIRRAWAAAIDQYRTAPGNSQRSIGIPGALPDRFPWQLFVKEGADIALDWNLPEAANDPLSTLPLPADLHHLPDMPFRFLGRYTREDAAIFFGRSRSIRRLYDRLTDPHGLPVSLLCGQSGVGKSSLLEAGVMPRLTPKCTVFYLRRGPEKGLVKTLQSALQTPEKTPADLLGAWKTRERSDGKPVVIILDQAEEAFTRPEGRGDQELEELAGVLKDLFDDPATRPAGKLLLSFRKEFEADIEDQLAKNSIPRESMIYLERLSYDEIIEVVNGLTSTERSRQKYGLSIEAGLPAAIATDLLSDKDTPVAPVLQIILTKLWQNLRPGRERVFTLQDYFDLKENGVFLGDFFRQQMEQIGAWADSVKNEAEKSGLALDILNMHVTELGFSNSRSLEELQKLYEHREDILHNLVAKFNELYLLTGLDDGKNALAHDALAPVILQEVRNSGRPGQKALRILAGKTANYARDPSKTFIDEEDLAIVEQGAAGMRMWLPEETALIEKSRERRRRLRRERAGLWSMSGLLLIAALWLAYEYVEKFRIEIQVSAARLEAVYDPKTALATLTQAFNTDPDNPAALAALADIYNNNEFYEQTIQFPGELKGVALAPDSGNIFYTWSDNALYRRDRSGAINDSFPLLGLSAAALSPDGRRILVAGWDGTLHAIDAASLRQEQQVECPDRRAVTLIVFSPDGQTVFAGSEQQVDLYSANDLRVINGGFSPDKQLTALFYHPFHHTLLIGYVDGSSEERTLNGRPVGSFNGHTDQVLAFAVNPHDSVLVTSGRDGLLNFWGKKGHLALTLKGHERRVEALAWSADGQRLFSASLDYLIKCWSPEGNLITTYKGHQGFLQALAISPNEKSFVSAGADGAVRWWKIESKVTQYYGLHQNGVSDICLSTDGTRLLTGSETGLSDFGSTLNDPNVDLDRLIQLIQGLHPRKASVWNGNTGEKQLDMERHTGGINAVDISGNGQRYATASDDKTVILWDRQGMPRKTLSGGHRGKVFDAAFSPDGKYILSAGFDSVAILWDTSGQPRHRLPHANVVRAAVWAPDGMTFATGSYGGDIRIYSTDGRQQLTLVTPDSLRVEALSFSPDGKYLLVGQGNNKIRLYDRKGKLVFETRIKAAENKTGGSAIRAVAFSPNGRWFCVGTEGGLALTFRIVDKQPVPVFRLQHYPRRSILSVQFSPDGRSVLTGSGDGWARMWGMAPFIQH